MLRWHCAAVVMIVVTTFAFLLVTGSYDHEGRVVATFSATHGLHVGDLFVLGAWAACMMALVGVARGSGRRN